MSESIVDIQHFLGDALRSSGYKDAESAVSEIIDNSIEAEAKNVFVILKDNVNDRTGRKNISEVGFLDDGMGMSDEILGKCLGLGVSTRRERKGMGRFGVGLPQASLYACPEVYVYSWQNGIENAKCVYLDINKIKSGEQKVIEDPKKVSIPKMYEYYINLKINNEQFDFKKNGTLVVWKNCDRIQPKTSCALKSRLEFSVGQKFRYFIHDKKCSIKIFNDDNKDDITTVFPNDPLFLMEDNYALGNPDEPKKIFLRGAGENLEPIFESYTTKTGKTGEVDIPVKYYDKNGELKTSNVKVRYSVVKNKFYDQTAISKGNPGDYEIGKYAKKLEGISVVRAGREIDFRKFDFYENVNEPEHRWWGCEIIFTPELDEVFGVSNNKQYVELKKIENNDLLDFEGLEPIWNTLSREISSTIKEMYKQNKEIRKSARTLPEERIPASTQTVNTVENNADDNGESETSKIKKTKSIEQLENEGASALIDFGVKNPSKDEIYRFLNNSVNFAYKDSGKFGPAFDYSFSLGTELITINIAHKFYTSFLEKVAEDENSKTTFELFLASFVRAVDKTNPQQQEQNDKLISTWQTRLNEYIEELLNPSEN